LYSKKRHIITVLVACVITFVITAALALGVVITVNLHSGIDIVVAAREMVRENYVDQLSEQQISDMNEAAIGAMVASLKDPYSYYFNADMYDQFQENSEEEYVGIGITIEYSDIEKVARVSSVNRGGPAEKAGVIFGDILLGADELTVEKHGYEAIVDHIKNGKKGEKVTVHISRASTDASEKKSIEIVREVITVETIEAEMLDDGIAYIKISNFQHNSVEHFAKALFDVEKNGATGMVIDLRGNPGGYADSVIKMTDMLLPEGTIAYLEDNKGRKEYFESDENCIDIPMAVLINESTASAAELMTGSLQAYDKAVVVGKKSFGKAVAQAPFMLTEETAIYLTTARYYTPKGECIDKKGITPDIEIDLPAEQKAQLSTLSYAEDVQLQAAITAIK